MTENETRKPKFSRAAIVVTIVILMIPVMLAIMYHNFTRPAMPPHLMKKIHAGMTKEEVRDLLGSPNIAEEDYVWQYKRFGNYGWVEIDFNKNGEVYALHDESFHHDPSIGFYEKEADSTSKDRGVLK